jgi:DNA repair exonuclease SbcCD ATPase subunit
MCYGPEGIEIYFQNYGNVVLVKGDNLDTGGSNGAGKSSICDALSYALYGKTVKKPKQLDHETIINAIHKERLEVVVEFDDYRIMRCREPNRLKVWCSKDHIWDEEAEVTKGTMGETQKYIDGVVGLSHVGFCNVIVFDDRNFHAFLEADAAGKRMIIENFLDLEKFRTFNEDTKEFIRTIKATVKKLTDEYGRLQDELDKHDKRITQINEQDTQWQNTKINEIKTLTSQMQIKQKDLENSDENDLLTKYNQIQTRIEELLLSIPLNEQKRDKLNNLLQEADKKLNELLKEKNDLVVGMNALITDLKEADNGIRKSKSFLQSLEKLESGQKCPTCYGSIAEENYANVMNHEKNVLDSLQASITKNTALANIEKEKLEKKNAIISKLNDHILDAKKKVKLVEDLIKKEQTEHSNLLKTPKPEIGVKQQILEAAIVSLKKQIAEKQDEASKSPYKEIYETAIVDKDLKKKECEGKTLELREAEQELPYYEYWAEAFGDRGIRKNVIEDIVPGLNSRLTYWLNYLMASHIDLKFDSEFKETILRNGTEGNYHAMSNGECRKINLSVSQSFSYVMILNSGSCPSLVFLDEVTGGGIDQESVVGVYNMIFELAKERQVFVTSHNPALLDLLQGCESITVVKKNDISRLEKS